MRRLLLLLFVALVLVALFSSSLFAASRSIEYRFHSIMTLLCRNMFPVSGMYFVPEEVIEIDTGVDGKVGGDADDYANGKLKPGPDEQKSNGGKVLGPLSGSSGSTLGVKSLVR